VRHRDHLVVRARSDDRTERRTIRRRRATVPRKKSNQTVAARHNIYLY